MDKIQKEINEYLNAFEDSIREELKTPFSTKQAQWEACLTLVLEISADINKIFENNWERKVEE